MVNTGGNQPRHGRREDSGEHYTYIRDPDGNVIELVNHPLGLADADGNKVELVNQAQGVRWVQLPGVGAQSRLVGTPLRGSVPAP